MSAWGRWGQKYQALDGERRERSAHILGDFTKDKVIEGVLLQRVPISPCCTLEIPHHFIYNYTSITLLKKQKR